ncbi:flavin reductase family protein [Microbacterium sp. NPDC058345]|uniref:flavin reductase family protein n=1 Tax=Microbacterium sp. NPDC058345 TaxID=3346455 RepID=UPI00365AB0A5
MGNVTPIDPHTAISPAILYFGTPVALLSTVDGTGDANIAPNSSVWWLGQTALVGVSASSQTGRNLLATGEVVINLPSQNEVDIVDRLALTTGRPEVSARKHAAGYRSVRDKFAHARVSPMAAETVAPPRIAELPVHLEGTVRALHPLDGIPDPADARVIAAEIAITRVHVRDSLRMPGYPNRIDPERWQPLLLSFQRFFGRGGEVMPSRLASIDEEWYRG